MDNATAAALIAFIDARIAPVAPAAATADLVRRIRALATAPRRVSHRATLQMSGVPVLVGR